ncbi:GlxA family transcriptional regulator [Bradyrhizobium sp. WSM1743]|uniref:GlxA family transcriptional regulator n=1 Tax=Bradyrhizobium sp. WSM1743 TaxID=318996 RepID=UPI000414D198|nr:GlxA family transcriptional regulator [Bradyrhizobium sp. WSM1743]
MAKLKIGFILARRFTLSAFANFIDVLRLSADEGDRSRPILCAWHVLSPTIEPITSSCGVTVQPEEPLGDPKRFDYLVVVGGLVDEIENLHPGTVGFLKRAAAIGVPLVGVCTGAFILHRAGLMLGYRACVSWFHHADFVERFNGLKPVSDQIFVVDRDRLTCSGGVSSAHLAAFIVERHLGRARAAKSLHIMIIDQAMTAEEPQPGMPLALATEDVVVRKALLLMQQSIDVPLSIGRVVQRLGVSRRNLERHFRESLAMTPLAADRLIRIEQAKHLLKTTKRSATQIAADTGFCDLPHLIRVFRAIEEMTPDAFRRKSLECGLVCASIPDAALKSEIAVSAESECRRSVGFRRRSVRSHPGCSKAGRTQLPE